jgi:hypothetical protein
MRVGDYQVIFDIQEANLRILKIIPPPRGWILPVSGYYPENAILRP